ncbi:acyl-CoA dehydrogenase family protein [Ramlibacter albus]|uniref:Acyl-CoA dehydrogenase family protein n=1 Tax=Ramlibacter albus TaxID=2079448 RepID=A0A923S4L2_9BURK|nr:acyl-CoA dehydrogenase family protein [Ramlibacter albus]MBC5767033.1 acyl-CoA dehydrogenase family protein [Ramlibacter albus]
MDFNHSPKTLELRERVRTFMDRHIYPNEPHFFHDDDWTPPKIVLELKPKAREAGLWNLFLPLHTSEKSGVKGAGLTNLEYAPLAEEMGKVSGCSEVFNCSAPDTGNMETLALYGTAEQKKRWLEPLLDGTIRSAFAMTEPEVASSDATNITTRIERVGDEYVINGRKWWISGAGDPRCAVYIVMGKTDFNGPKHSQQSMVMVPADTPGVTVKRHLKVLGFSDAPHGHMEIIFENVRVPVSNILLGEGRGFEIAQGRLGPGRIHHCMRLIGLAERCLDLMCKRVVNRVAFGKPLSAQTVTQERIAEARCRIDMARLLTLRAAWMMDNHGNKVAKNDIAMIKVVAPGMAQQVIDWAIQAHGGGGLSQDFPFARFLASARTLRIADGPDEVHRNAIAKNELSAHLAAAQLSTR